MQNFYISNDIWVASEYHQMLSSLWIFIRHCQKELGFKGIASMQVSLSSWVYLAILRIKLRVKTDAAPR